MTLRPHPPPHPHPQSAAWAPSSPCGPECLGADPPATAPGVLVAARVAALASVLLAALVIVPFGSPAGRLRRLRACCRAALRAAGVRLRVTGAVPPGGALVVANHISWVEILAIGAIAPVRMLAKREVRDWPMIGALAHRVGAMFVNRTGLRGLPATVATTAAALRAGAVVGVFPEGTTWCGAAAGPFRRAAFQAAIEAGVPVVPVAVVLRPPAGTPVAAAAFVGDETIWHALLRVLRMRALECSLTVLPPLAPGPDRRELARSAGEAIGSVTGVAHPAGRTAPVARPAVAA